ncbi:MAG: cupin domain-containing protein [Pseudomonadales bacterium]|nr:cupin domain-containing protein [Pseudomonadales bacterium]MBO6597320.1 cupin domain-containing protein [Pseudomonadales bacterium]MBO6824054.1 cupin domain-containing protein [Pseudomonadales bacterium]
MKTRKFHISEIEPDIGIPAGVKDPLRPERFERIRRSHLARNTGITQFGVNQITLEQGVFSSLRHWHEGEDEFVYVLSGAPTLIDENGETELAAGHFVAFPAGEANAHCFTNKKLEEAVLLVIGSKKPGEDACHYPDDPLGRIER